jgi:cation:H+ antiporter
MESRHFVTAEDTVIVGMFFGGLILLVAGAEALVRGAARLAMAVGMSPLVVGLTVVAYGTGAPEMAVSVQAAVSGRSDLGVGNVVGSNIFNILLILGISASITPLIVARQVVRQEVPIMIGVSLLLLALGADGFISFRDGSLFVALLVGYTALLIHQSRRASADGSPGDPIASESAWDRHWSVQVLLIVGGLALLVLGSRWLVDAAVAFARGMGLSELVIGLTIVAAGTSLPEVATSITAAIRGQRDIAVGNVIGSNTFNILGVLGVSAVVAPAGLSVAPSLFAFDLPVMAAVATACLPIFFTRHLIARWEGATFLLLYAAYTLYLLLAAQQHDVLPMYSAVMLFSVLPLLALTLIVVVWREAAAARKR